MMRVRPRALRSPRAAGALLAATMAGACADDSTREPQVFPEGEITLWPIPEVGLDAGRRASDGGLGPSSRDASLFPWTPRADSAADAPMMGPDAGPPGRCGDGRVDPGRGEHCDDANDDDGDGCNNDCHESARLLWSHDNEPNIYATTFAVDDAGTIAVAGFSIPSSGKADLWVNKYSADGTAAWPRAQTLDVGHDEGAEAIAFVPGGDVVVMGSSQVLGSRAESAVLLMRYAESDGASRWAEPSRAMAGPEHVGTTLLIDASERIYALATFRPEERLDVWLQAFSPMGSPLWPNALQLNEGLGEFPGALWLAPDGALRVYWTATPGLPMDLVRADVSADDGSATIRHTALSEMRISNDVNFAVDPQGAVVVCANILMGERRVLWMQKFSLEGAPLWAKEVLEEAVDTLQCNAVALDSNGNVAVAGVLSGARASVWLRLYAPD
jgi:cysteine-rich repeat protein